MSELGELSAEVRSIVARITRTATTFADLERRHLAKIEVELRQDPRTHGAATLVASARASVSAASRAAIAAREKADRWLELHGSELRGGAGGAAQSGGTVGGWNPALNSPAPNSHYVVDGYYEYDTDALGRTTHVEGRLQRDAGVRSPSRQRTAGGDDRLDTDHGGHLVATRFGGPGEALNLVPMDKLVNGSRGAWYDLEKHWATLQSQGYEVDVRVDVVYGGATSRRPTKIDVTYAYSFDGAVVGKEKERIANE